MEKQETKEERIADLESKLKQQDIQIQQLYSIVGNFQNKLMNVEALVTGQPFTKPNEKDLFQ